MVGLSALWVRLRVLWRMGAVVVCTFGCIGAFRLGNLVFFGRDVEARRCRWLGVWARSVLAALGVRLTLSCSARASLGEGARLIVSNHRSPADILVLMHLFQGRILAHGGVAEMPGLGFAAGEARTIFVDREDPKSGGKAIRAMRRALRAGDTVMLFPEATTFVGDEVRPFKRGALVASRGTETELIPVGLAYPEGCEFFNESLGAHMGRMIRRAHTPVAVSVGRARPAPRSSDEAMEDLREEVQGLVHEARSLANGQGD